ncbi:hypothetical protein GGR33_005056 [Methylobacterium brachythecii]|uniref:Uncharacterized protein n=2 Tax=Methylobacterium brachythecii TaxID=1176177 RepID=A0A7W6AL78_9HYPH|nr:hypothetical protein [Methylobacterium brachythecii]GLS46243.1 hypothetical protein GCM10007884_42350 [Methylobacterium brachythecii]
MTFWLALRRLLPLLAVVSLALSPSATSAAAMGMRAPMSMPGHMMAMPDGQASGAVAAMDEMPCCPPDRPAAPDCSKSCPLLALCFAKVATGLPTGFGFPVRIGVVTGPTWSVAADFDSLAQAPSPEPPRS